MVVGPRGTGMGRGRGRPPPPPEAAVAAPSWMSSVLKSNNDDDDDFAQPVPVSSSIKASQDTADTPAGASVVAKSTSLPPWAKPYKAKTPDPSDGDGREAAGKQSAPSLGSGMPNWGQKSSPSAPAKDKTQRSVRAVEETSRSVFECPIFVFKRRLAVVLVNEVISSRAFVSRQKKC